MFLLLLILVLLFFLQAICYYLIADFFYVNMVQPNSIKNNEPYIKDLLIKEIEERSERGLKTYNTYLQANNGRNVLQDLLEELLDACHYVKQEIEERFIEPTELW